MDIRSLRFDVGDEVCGWGRLVRTVEGDFFDPPIPVRLPGSTQPSPPPRRASRYGVRVEGADLAAVERRYERGAAVEGYATVYGQWQGDHIAVHQQTQERADPHHRRWVDPPCPPPAGGWPRGMNGQSVDNLDFDLGDLQETGAAVGVTTFRPSDNRAVLVVAAADIGVVDRQLRSQLADRLCVIASRWTRGQLDQARDHLRKMREPWGIYMIGGDNDELGQAHVSSALTRVTDEIADWVSTQPTGLVELRPWLAPFPQYHGNSP